MTEDWTGCSYHVLKSNPMVPGDGPIMVIGYKYNSRKVLSFVAREEAGSTKSNIPYLSDYPDQFANVSIHPVVCPQIVSKLYGSSN